MKLDKVQLGRNIRHERKCCKMTLRELCKDTGLGLGTLSEIENGNIDPKVSTLIKISDSLCVSIERLIFISSC